MVSAGRLGSVDWGATVRPLAGQVVSGDQFSVLSSNGGVLIAIMDGLGHGPAAAGAAERARDVLSSSPARPLEDLVLRCHEALLETRGAAMTLARIDIDRDALTWLGVGNVAGSVVRTGPAGIAIEAGVLLFGGVVGYQLPPVLKVRTVALRPGDLLLFATDGVAREFDAQANFSQSPRQLAAGILERCATGTDDALVLAARYWPVAP